MPTAAALNNTPLHSAHATSMPLEIGDGALMPPSVAASAAPASIRGRELCGVAPALLGAAKELTTVTDPATGVLPAPTRWKIYVILSFEGRAYVGVTKTTAEARMVRHAYDARCRLHLGGPDTITAAIRRAFTRGLEFESAFQMQVVAETSSADQARQLEAEWIAKLRTARPWGYNVMPGGASLGGPLNAVPVTVKHPIHGTVRYESMTDAVEAINSLRLVAGKQALELYTVYARRTMGWSVEEALGLSPHRDGRGERPAFLWDGRIYSSLRKLARARGVRPDAARSKLYRAKLAGCGADYDIAQDRRRAGSLRTGNAGTGRQPPLVLPHPEDPGATVHAAKFARLAGVPKATVLHRYQRIIRSGRDPALMPSDELLAKLTEKQDRRVTITLVLADGRRLTGGVRMVIRKVFADKVMKFGRHEWIGFSTIRARLRRIPGWPNPELLSPAAVRWAFGMQPDGCPDRVPPAVTA